MYIVYSYTPMDNVYFYTLIDIWIFTYLFFYSTYKHSVCTYAVMYSIQVYVYSGEGTHRCIYTRVLLYMYV